MENSIDKELQIVDKQVIELFNLIGTNGDISLIAIEKQIDILRNQVDLKHSKIYKLQCCDKD
jgi:hypothetical protein